jgi:hypothetical protein
VLDPGGQIPAHVLRTARAVAGSAPFYAFVSTTAVYRTWNTSLVDESAATWPSAPDQDGDPADLGKLPVHKRGCELAVEQTFGPDACLIARAGPRRVPPRERPDCAPARSATRSWTPGSGCGQAARSRPHLAPRHSASSASRNSRC